MNVLANGHAHLKNLQPTAINTIAKEVGERGYLARTNTTNKRASCGCDRDGMLSVREPPHLHSGGHWRRRATNHWLVQRGCYAFPNQPALGWRDKAYDLLPFGRRRRRVRRSHNEIDERLICTNERQIRNHSTPCPEEHVKQSVPEAHKLSLQQRGERTSKIIPRLSHKAWGHKLISLQKRNVSVFG
ncbi:hypothetical protein EVAR_48268_1 [Eumeta japonica]|uniref:Uncharacterized protein n=1 Tax=Eumeta variegata TaxID=151549 RepID=A0A4C1Y289_EUMVA|nr:hypothetical protein EVAR_48268_1 [Eumeta japonica]